MVTHTSHTVSSPAVQGTSVNSLAQKRISWGGIILGFVISLAILFLLSLLGMGIGFSVVDPLHDQNPLNNIGIGTMIYFVVIQLVSLGVGGYIAGRLSPKSRTTVSALHGAGVWALTTLAALWLATSGASTAISSASSVVNSVASATGQTMQAAIPDDFSVSDITEIDVPNSLPQEVIAQLPADLRQAIRNRQATLNNIRTQATQAARNVISTQEQNAIEAEVSQTARQIVRNPANADQKINQMIDGLFGPGQELSETDRRQMINQLARTTNVSPQEAEAQLNEWQTQIEQTAQDVEQSIEAAKQDALETAEAATDALSKAAFTAFVASLLGLIASLLGGILGKPEDTYAATRI